jgi:hypothetical protein
MSRGTSVPSVPALDYLEEEYKLGTLSYHTDGNKYIFSFYNPEDEAAFILRFGNYFISNEVMGFYHCPYIPAGL